MTHRYKIEAIILKRKNMGEADRLLTVFSKEHGKLNLLAKGIRRIPSRRSPHLELFNHVSMLIHRGKSLDTILEVSPLATFQQVKKDLKSIALAYTTSELVDVLCAPHQEHKNVYDFIISTFTNLDRQSDFPYEFGQEIGKSLLSELGFLPKSSAKNLDGLRFVETVTEKKLVSRAFLDRCYIKGGIAS